ncbi:MAG: shikimate kinase AroK [Gammaproteobacteria bacterium]|nr:shikimate kinase AroK [Gammaproteobacteria bacterium]MDP2139885.1 shikimate kinase AroK [Gammaproteobacteria bacterium]MDP2347705.1 shikimate kinase AroK [Gammaproteobacteria bacterium]
MDTPDNIFLIGPMGVGKSTIGRLLAAQLHMPFFDSDREIEYVTGADIPWIFDVEGEQGFRIREARMIDTLSRREGIILATGGGAILAPESRSNLKSRGIVVYLRASVAQQLERTGKDKNRPLLQTENPLAKIKELIKIREPLYRETAHVTVDTSRRSPRSVTAEILRQIEEYKAVESAQ